MGYGYLGGCGPCGNFCGGCNSGCNSCYNNNYGCGANADHARDAIASNRCGVTGRNREVYYERDNCYNAANESCCAGSERDCCNNWNGGCSNGYNNNWNNGGGCGPYVGGCGPYVGGCGVGGCGVGGCGPYGGGFYGPGPRKVWKGGYGRYGGAPTSRLHKNLGHNSKRGNVWND